MRTSNRIASSLIIQLVVVIAFSAFSQKLSFAPWYIAVNIQATNLRASEGSQVDYEYTNDDFHDCELTPVSQNNMPDIRDYIDLLGYGDSRFNWI